MAYGREPNPWLSVIAWTLLLPAAAGCVGGDRAPAALGEFAARDSAGIAILESPRAVWAGGAEWRIGALPLVQLGGDAASGVEAFGYVTSARFLPGGGFVVIDSRARRLHIFEDDGRHRLSFGRGGQGPGELRHAAGEFGIGHSLTVARDGRIFVSEPASGRANIFDVHGRFLQMRDVGRDVRGIPPWQNGIWTILADGSFFASLVQLGSDSDLMVTGIAPAGAGEFRELHRIQRQMVRGGDRTMLASPFTSFPSPAVRTDPLEVWVPDRSRPEIRAYDGDGRLLRVVRINRPRLPTAPYVAAERARRAAMEGHPRRRENLAAFDQLTHPDTVPAFGSVVIDAEGYLWISRFPLTGGDEISRSYNYVDIIDPDGRWLGPVELPQPTREVLDITRDRILMRARDELGSTVIRIYAIHGR